ncbi:LOW QUALITY PROTEIN: Protein CBG22666, partial [Caenorhabditis briggsae]
MADTSIRSTHSNISRGARPESGRLHRRYPYRWFDQVHVKSLIFHVEVCLLAIAFYGLYHGSIMNSDEQIKPISIPGFDGVSTTGDDSYRIHNGGATNPLYRSARNMINFASYFLIFSSITGFLGMRLSETSISRRNFPPRLNPATLLIPSSLAVIALMYPLFVWSLRSVHSTIRHLIRDNFKISVIIDAFRLSLIPIIFMWALYIYFLYGFWLGALYYQRRGDPPTPTTQDSPFRRPLRKSLMRFQAKGLFFPFPAIFPFPHTTFSSVLSTASSPLIPQSSSTSSTSSTSSSSSHLHNRSMSPPKRQYRHLETVDEEAQSRTSS